MAISAKMSNRKIRITPYMKNVGRSLGYAVGDAVAAYNPTISNILKTTKDTVSSAKTSIREMKANALAGGKDIMNSQNAFTNIIDDLKSGNWYNKSREDNIFGDMGFDDDFDFDDDNWGDDDESSPTEASNFIDEATSSKSIAKAIIGSSTSQTKAYGKASAVSADYIVKSTNKSLSAMYQLNAQGFSQVSELLLSVNTTLTGIATLGQPLSEHIQNSAVFFTETTQKLESIDNKLEKISNSLSVFDGIVNKKKSGSNRRITLGDMLFDGQFDMSTYMDMVKENYKSVKDLYSGLLDMGTMMAGKGGKNLSPLATAMKYGMQALIPKFARESMQEFNKTLSETIGVALTRGTKKAKAKGGILGFLADIFGLDDRSTKFSTAGYDKGPMQWDGVAKQALVNVIPTYLAKIYAKLGGEEKYYNYETGKYETLKTIREREDESTANYAKRAGGQFRQDLLSEVDKLPGNAGNKEYIKSQVEEFILKCYINNIDLSDLLSGLTDSQMMQKFGLGRTAAELLRSYVGSSGKRKSKGAQQLLRFENDIIIEKRKQSRGINDASSSGTSELVHLYDAFGENVGALHNDSTMQIKYLRGLYEISANIQQNLAYLARKQGARIKYTPYDIDDNLGSSYQQATSSFKYAHEVTTGGRNAQYYIDTFGMTEDEYKLKTFDMNYAQIQEFEREAKRKLAIKNGTDALKNTAASFTESGNEDPDKMKSKLKFLNGPFDAATNMINTITSGIIDVFYGKESVTEVLKKKLEESDLFKSIRDEFRALGAKAKRWWNGPGEQTPPETGSGSGLYIPSGGFSGADIRERGAKNVARDSIVKFLTGVNNNIADFFVKNDEEKKKYETLINELFSKENTGAVGVGALGGVGVSVLTGAIVGPLAGAALGAATGLIAKSTAVQDVLFGKPSENGDYEKGLLGDLGKAIKQNIPTIKNTGIGAGIGLVGGTLLGSPLLGLFLGSGIGFATKSQEAKEWLFGKEVTDKEGNKSFQEGVIPKDVQEKLKKAAPNMAVGALGGLVAGPFGIVGNLMFGSALGYLSTSDKFQDYIFGPKDANGKRSGKEGLVGTIKTNVVDKIEDAFMNFGSALTGFAKRLSSSVLIHTRNIVGAITSKVSAAVENTFIGRTATNLVKGIINAPINIASKGLDIITNGSLKKNLAVGNKVWGTKDDGTKGWLNASERNKLREKKGYKRSDMDNILAGASLDDLNRYDDLLRQARDGKYAAGRNQKNILKRLYDGLKGSGLKADVQNEIANKLLNGLTVNAFAYGLPAKYNELFTGIANSLSENTDGTASKNAREEIQSKLGVKLGAGVLGKKFGVSNIASIQSLINQEKGRLSSMTEEQKIVAKEEAYNYDKITLLEAIAMALGAHVDKLKTRPAEIIKEDIKNIGDAATSAIAAPFALAGGLASAGADKIKGKGKGLLGSIFGGIGNFAKGIGHSTMTMFGRLKTKTNSQGEEEVDLQDSETVETQKKTNKFLDGIGSIPVISSAIGGVKGLIDKIKTGLFGSDDGNEEENKFSFKNILSKIGGILKGLGVGILGASSVYALIKNKDSLFSTAQNVGTTVYASATTQGGFLNSIGHWFTDEDKGLHKLINEDIPGILGKAKNWLNDNIIEPIIAPIGDGISQLVKGIFSEDGALHEVFSNVLTVSKSFRDDLFTEGGTLNGIAKGIGGLSTRLVNSLFDDGKDDGKEGILHKAVRATGDFISKMIDDLNNEKSTLYRAVHGIADFTADFLDNGGFPVLLSVIAAAKLNSLTGGLLGKGIGAGIKGAGKFIAGTAVPAVGTALGNASTILSGGSVAGLTTGGAVAAGVAGGAAAAAAAVGGYKLGEAFTKTGLGEDMYKYLTEPVLDFFTKKIPEGAENISNIVNQYKDQITDAAYNGDISGVWNVAKDNTDKSFSGGIANLVLGLDKIFLTPVAGVTWIGKKVGDGISSIINGIKTSFEKASDAQDEIADFAVAGDVSGLWNTQFYNNDGTITGGIADFMLDINKVLMTPVAGINWIGNKIKSGFDAIITDPLAKYKEIGANISGLEYDDNQSLSSNVNTLNNINTKTGNPIFDALLGINKFFRTIGFAISSMKNLPIIKEIRDLADWISGGNSGGITTGKELDADKVAAAQGYDWSNKPTSGGASGFINQTDPRYSGYHIAGTSFADNGCGPSVAAMAAGAMGKNMSVGEAVSASKPYQNRGGVSIDYFANALGRKGINTRIISGGGAGDIYASLAKGNKAVLLGRDPYNTSKAFSPFGPKNHYVLATGLDRRGNVIVNDPELRGPRAYSPNILRSTSYAVAGGNSGLFRYGNYRSLRSVYGGASGVAQGYAYNVYYTEASGYSSISGYAVMVPNSGATSGLPMIVYCHGDGEIGYTADGSKLVGPGSTYSNLPNWLFNGTITPVNAIILIPQIKDKNRSGSGLANLVKDVAAQYNVDTNRISGTGHSGGAIIVNNASTSGVFSCMVLMSGYGLSTGSIPTISFCGSNDDPGSLNKMKSAVSTVANGGGNAVLYIINGATHSGASSVCNAYRAYPILNWMIAQSKSSASKVNAGIHNIGNGETLPEFSSNMGTYTPGSTSSYASNTGTQPTDTKKAIWDFFKSRGWSDAATAGAMGCWQAESGNNPKRLEGDYLGAFKSRGGYDVVVPGTAACDDYVVNGLFPAYDKSGVKINKSAYMSDGHYYPGMGLAQWTGGRTIALNKYAQANNMNPYSLKAQLDFASQEISKRGLDNPQYANETDLRTATNNFLTKYEGISGDKHLNPRVNHAAALYNQYSGSTINTDFGALNGGTFGSAISGLTSGNTTGSSVFNSILSAAANIGAIFSNALGSIFGKSGSSLSFGNNASAYSTGDYSSYGDYSGWSGDTYDWSTNTGSMNTYKPMSTAERNPGYTGSALKFLGLSEAQKQIIMHEVDGISFSNYGAQTMYNNMSDSQIGALVGQYKTAYEEYKRQKKGAEYASQYSSASTATAVINKTTMLKYAKNNDETRYLKYLMGMIPDDGSMAAVKNRIGTQRLGYLSGLVNKYGLAGTYSANYTGELGSDYVNYLSNQYQSTRDAAKASIKANTIYASDPIFYSDYYGYTVDDVLNNQYKYPYMDNNSGGASGLLRSMPSQKISGVNTKKYRRLKVNNNISGGASGISSYEVSSMLNTIKNDPRLQSGNGISPDLVSNLIEAITTLLSNIANNTAPIEKIYQALSTYMTNTTVPTGGGSGVSDNGSAKVVRTKAPTYSASHNNVSPSMDIDANIKNLVGTLAQLAKG